MNGKKILIAGNWRSPIHEEPLSRAFQDLGCEVVEFKWNPYFYNSDGSQTYSQKAQYKLTIGPIVHRINRELIAAVQVNKPDIVFFYRPNVVSGSTVKRIKRLSPETIVCAYNNDDPFSERYPWYVWQQFKRAIPEYDVMFSYRPSNISGYESFGANAVVMLPPWYVKELNHPVALSDTELNQYGCDVVFIGHHEKDGRVEILKRLIRSGLKVRLFGPEWDEYIKHDAELSAFYPVRYLRGEDYNKALCGAKMALVIYSSMNNDVYTRRCFEIPATGTMMLAKRTNEMQALYKEDQEAVYFDSVSELVEKAKRYSADPELCESIGENGKNRAFFSGYEVRARAKQILSDLESLSEEAADINASIGNVS